MKVFVATVVYLLSMMMVIYFGSPKGAQKTFDQRMRLSPRLRRVIMPFGLSDPKVWSRQQRVIAIFAGILYTFVYFGLLSKI